MANGPISQTCGCRVKESIHGRGPYNEDKGACPLHYQRMTYEDVRDRGQVPYLLGGRRQPHCRTCNSKAPWANFCSWDHSKFSGCAPRLCTPLLLVRPIVKGCIQRAGLNCYGLPKFLFEERRQRL